MFWNTKPFSNRDNSLWRVPHIVFRWTLNFHNCLYLYIRDYANDLVQECSISIVNALEILQSCTKPSILCHHFACWYPSINASTVYPKKYAHGFVALCFIVITQSFIMNSHEVFIHIHQGCFAGTGAIVRLPQCQWSNGIWENGKMGQWIWENQSMYNHNKAQQSKNRVHISRDIL